MINPHASRCMLSHAREEPARIIPVGRLSDSTVADRFVVLWDALADVLGTAATATLLRRAMRSAAGRVALDGPAIRREGFSYAYSVPERWRAAHDGQPQAELAAVLDELRPLLVELTGGVVVGRLERLGIMPPSAAAGDAGAPLGSRRP